jgi:hypothetical protein
VEVVVDGGAVGAAKNVHGPPVRHGRVAPPRGGRKAPRVNRAPPPRVKVVLVQLGAAIASDDTHTRARTHARTRTHAHAHTHHA